MKSIKTNNLNNLNKSIFFSNQDSTLFNINNTCVKYNLNYSEFLGTGSITLANSFQQSKRVRYIPDQFRSYHGMLINNNSFNSSQNFLK